MDFILGVLDNKFLNVAHYRMKITFKSLLVKFFKRQDPLEGPSASLSLSLVWCRMVVFLWFVLFFFFPVLFFHFLFFFFLNKKCRIGSPPSFLFFVSSLKSPSFKFHASLPLHC